MTFLNGVKIIEVPESVTLIPVKKQIIFPKRKNRRIQARFRNNPKYWTTIFERRTYVIGGDLYADTTTIAVIKEEFQKKPI